MKDIVEMSCYHSSLNRLFRVSGEVIAEMKQCSVDRMKREMFLDAVRSNWWMGRCHALLVGYAYIWS